MPDAPQSDTLRSLVEHSEQRRLAVCRSASAARAMTATAMARYNSRTTRCAGSGGASLRRLLGVTSPLPPSIRPDCTRPAAAFDAPKLGVARRRQLVSAGSSPASAWDTCRRWHRSSAGGHSGGALRGATKVRSAELELARHGATAAAWLHQLAAAPHQSQPLAR